MDSVSSLPSRYDHEIRDEDMSDEILNFMSPEASRQHRSGSVARGKQWFKENRDK